MSRVILPFDDWPEADRRAWDAAIRADDILDGQGPAARWRPATRRTNIQHYGRWLGYWINTGKDLDGMSPEERVTRQAVAAYLDSLSSKLAPRTTVSALVGLKVMMKAMSPDTDWQWLAHACNRLNRTSLPSKDKRSRMKPTGEIVKRALSELDCLGAGPLSRRLDRVAFRDNLMLALLALRPLRLGNFAHLQIGRDLLNIAGKWQIDIPVAETKTGQSLLFDVPSAVQPYLEIYIDGVRPPFLAKATSDSCVLWLGFEGRPLTSHSIYLRIVALTERLFGHPINPHLLRDCAATTLSTRSVEDALAAAPLLGHRSFATTERHYIRANQLEASREIAKALQLAKSNPEET